MSDTLRNLRAGRNVSWGSLVPAFDWAIHEAIEAEYRASVASDAALSHIAPTYPTIVALLAEAGRATAERGSRITDAARADAFIASLGALSQACRYGELGELS